MGRQIIPARRRGGTAERGRMKGGEEEGAQMERRRGGAGVKTGKLRSAEQTAVRIPGFLICCHRYSNTLTLPTLILGCVKPN